MSLVPGLPLFLAFLIACAMPSLHRPAAAESAPDWSPQSSERLVRLPSDLGTAKLQSFLTFASVC